MILCAILFLIFASCYYFLRTSDGNFDKKLGLIMLAYSSLPLLDFLTDVWYVFTSQYATKFLFLMSLVVFIMPEAVYWRGLFLQGVVVKFWILSIPEKAFFKEYDNVFKLAITGILSIPFVIVNFPILLAHFIVGMVLNSTKIIAVGRLSTLWFQGLTGSSKFSSNAIIDTQVLNSSIFSHLFFRTFPHVIVQVINNTYLGNWTLVAKLSIFASGLAAVNGVYRIIYIKFFLKQDVVDAPIRLTVGGLVPLNYDINATFASPHVYRSKPLSIGSTMSGETLPPSFQAHSFTKPLYTSEANKLNIYDKEADDRSSNIRESEIEMRISGKEMDVSFDQRTMSAALDFGVVFVDAAEDEQSNKSLNPLHPQFQELLLSGESIPSDTAHHADSMTVYNKLGNKIDKLSVVIGDMSHRIQALEHHASAETDSVRYSDVSDVRKSRLQFDL